MSIPGHTLKRNRQTLNLLFPLSCCDMNVLEDLEKLPGMWKCKLYIEKNRVVLLV